MSQSACKQCGGENEPSAKFCTSCGAYLDWSDEGSGTKAASTVQEATPEQRATPTTPAPTPQSQPQPKPQTTPAPTPEPAGPPPRVCTRCGQSNEATRNFCRRCGEALAPGAATAGAAAAVTQPQPAQAAPGDKRQKVLTAAGIIAGGAVVIAVSLFLILRPIGSGRTTGGGASPSPRSTPDQSTTAPGGKAAVSFVAPPAGGRVAGPRVHVWLSIENFKLVEAGKSVRRGEGHAHLLVDVDPATLDKAIPTDQPGVIHLGKAPFDGRMVELSPGPHVLYAVLGDSAHLVVPGAAAARVDFTVGSQWTGRGELPNACAEVASGSGEVRLIFPNEGGVLQGSVVSTCRFKTEDGRCSWSDVAMHRILGGFDGKDALSGTATGRTVRTLEAGERSVCGADQTLPVTPYKFSGTKTRTGVKAAIGAREFLIRHDEHVQLQA